MDGISKYDIIMLPLPRWDSNYASTSLSLAFEFSRTHRVFVIDNPFTFLDYFKYIKKDFITARKNALLKGKDCITKLDGYPEGFYSVTPRLVLPINWLPKGLIYNYLSKINNQIVLRCINKTIRKFQIKKYVFINSFNPIYLNKPNKSFKPDLYVYHTVDDISESLYISRHGHYREIEALRYADLIVTTSRELLSKVTKISERAHLIPNAANIELFNKAISVEYPVPDELKGTNTKVITYTGNLDIRVDYKLIKKLALAFPNYIILLIGPISSQEYLQHDIDKFTNVFLAGKKKLEELPAYLKHSDIGIIPFKCNKLTKSIYPLKINEYLAAGLPVVSTNFSEDIFEFRDIIDLAKTDEQFLKMVSNAIASNSAQKTMMRISYCEDNNWFKRSEHFLELINIFLLSKKNKLEVYQNR